MVKIFAVLLAASTILSPLPSWQPAAEDVEAIARTLYGECRINLVIERPDGVSKDIQEIFAAMGKQPWHKLRIRTGGKDGK